jgi:hypothetical protein
LFKKEKKEKQNEKKERKKRVDENGYAGTISTLEDVAVIALPEYYIIINFNNTVK